MECPSNINWLLIEGRLSVDLEYWLRVSINTRLWMPLVDMIWILVSLLRNEMMKKWNVEYRNIYHDVFVHIVFWLSRSCGNAILSPYLPHKVFWVELPHLTGIPVQALYFLPRMSAFDTSPPFQGSNDLPWWWCGYGWYFLELHVQFNGYVIKALNIRCFDIIIFLCLIGGGGLLNLLISS